MEKTILSQVLDLLNKARANEDGWSVEQEFYKLRDENPGTMEVNFCNDGGAHNALLITVFDFFTRFFILSQDGSSVDFYFSPQRLDHLTDTLVRHVKHRGPVCMFCSHKIKEIPYVFTSRNVDPKTGAPIVINTQQWHCDNCGHDHLGIEQEDHIQKILNQILKPDSK